MKEQKNFYQEYATDKEFHTLIDDIYESVVKEFLMSDDCKEYIKSHTSSQVLRKTLDDALEESNGDWLQVVQNEVKKELEHLIRENKDLEKRVKFNEEKVEYFTSIQETLNKSIIVAQEAADRLRENARKDAEIIIFEAEKTAEELLKEAAEKATQINRETDAIKKETRIFRQRLQILSQTQLEMIKNEEWDMVLNTPSQIEVTPPTIDSIIEKRAKRTEHLTEEEQQ
mgnify:CR=1 FL=1